MPFAALGLTPDLVRALSDRGYSEPTPIQARVIPEILAGRDILAGAQTGTGKTAGFTLPLLQRLQAQPAGGPAPRALILVPTRELAAQVHDSIKSYGKYLRLRTQVVFGGVSINPQIDGLRRGADILVATPGRLLDHAQQRTVDLSRISILVLDEADRMLDMGFIADIRRIAKLLPSQRQNLLFSATYSEDIRKLAQSMLRNPVEIEVARRNAAVDTVEQRAYFIGKDQKRSLLSHLILDGDWSQVLVFTRTKHGANRLTKQLLQDGVTAAAIHGNKSQSARTQALANFKAFNVRALVATEVASRGLDIRELPYVVNYELPNVPEDYVHRIGRTGRAGATGVAVSLVAPDESGLLKDIEKLLRNTIPRAAPPLFELRKDRAEGEHAAAAPTTGREHRPRHAHAARPKRGAPHRSAASSSSDASARRHPAGEQRGARRQDAPQSSDQRPRRQAAPQSRPSGGQPAQSSRASYGRSFGRRR